MVLTWCLSSFLSPSSCSLAAWKVNQPTPVFANVDTEDKKDEEEA